MNWIKDHTLAAAALALAGLLVLVIVGASLLSGSDDELPTPSTGPAEAVSDASPSTTQPPLDEADGPEVPPIACESLLELSEIDAALGIQLADFIRRELRGERCRTELPAHPGHWIQIEPGDQADFATEAEFFGVDGLLIEGIGDAAVWFVGEDPEEDGVVGLLSVYKDTPLGALLFRIRLGRPDVGDEVRLEAAAQAALAALPRFPGATLEDQPEPVAVTFEVEPVDESLFTYEGNLEARVEAGEWTHEEGLIATLRLLAGEVPAEQVLRHGSVVFEDTSLVVTLAEKHLDAVGEGADPELIRLFRRLAPTAEDLDQAHDPEPQEVGVAPLAVQVAFVQEDYDWCLDWYGVPGGCLDKVPIPVIEQMWPGKHSLSVPRPGKVTIFEDLGIPLTEIQIDWARESMLKSLETFEPLGVMPPATVLLGAPYQSGVDVDRANDSCFIGLDVEDSLSERNAKQGLAFYLAWCLLRNDSEQWWMPGMAMYLSGVVYPDINREHDFGPRLEARELSTTLLNRDYDNWILFEFLHSNRGGHQFVYENRSDLPEVTKSSFHQFARDLTNSEIADIGLVIDLVPFTAPAWTLNISGPIAPTDLAPDPWGVRRLEMTVSGGQYACVFASATTDAVEAAWRSSPVKGGGPWGEVPAVINGTSTLVVTSTGPGAFNFEVSEVVEDQDDCQNQSEPEADPCLQICRPSLYYEDPELITIEEDISGR